MIITLSNSLIFTQTWNKKNQQKKENQLLDEYKNKIQGNKVTVDEETDDKKKTS